MTTQTPPNPQRFGLARCLALVRADARSIQRDSLLRWSLIACLLFFLPILRWGPPTLNGWLISEHGFDLSPWFPLIQSSCLLVAPVLVGIVGGLLMVDQRDEGIATALSVTPLGVDGYLIYRVTLPALAGFFITVAMLGLVNLAPISVTAIVLCSLCAAPLAPLLALTIALLADNKIQGFAIAKANGVVTAPIIAAWFVAPPTQWLFLLLPTYLPVKICWLAMDQQNGFWLVPISLLIHGVQLRWLHRRVARRQQWA
ncbi:MAG: hypothetical protein AB8B96_02625 [Lysobacterales bacterium]